jgi:hypothetical protein
LGTRRWTNSLWGLQYLNNKINNPNTWTIEFRNRVEQALNSSKPQILYLEEPITLYPAKKKDDKNDETSNEGENSI